MTCLLHADNVSHRENCIVSSDKDY